MQSTASLSSSQSLISHSSNNKVSYCPVLLRFPTYAHRRPVIPIPKDVHWGCYNANLLAQQVTSWKNQELSSLVPPPAVCRPSLALARTGTLEGSSSFPSPSPQQPLQSTEDASEIDRAGNPSRGGTSSAASRSNLKKRPRVAPTTSQPSNVASKSAIPTVTFQFVNVPCAAQLLRVEKPQLCVQRLLNHGDLQAMQRAINEMRSLAGTAPTQSLIQHIGVFESPTQPAIHIDQETWYVTEQWFEGVWTSLPEQVGRDNASLDSSAATPLTNIAMCYLRKQDGDEGPSSSPSGAGGVALPSLLKHGEGGVVLDETLQKKRRLEEGWVVEPVCAVGHILTMHRTR